MYCRLPPFIDIDDDVDVFLYIRPPAIGSKRLIGYFGWCGFMEQIILAARRPLEAFILAKPLFLKNAPTLTLPVFVDINIAMAPRKSVVLLEAEVLILVTATATSLASASSAPSTSSHALKSVAVPSFASTTGRIVKSVQVAC